MPILDWLSDVAARGLVTVSVLFGGADPSIQERPGAYQGGSQQQAPSESEAVKTLKALVIAVESLVKETAGDDESKRAKREEAERNKADLAAQLDQARWAFWMVIIGAVQLVVSAVTLGLLWGTFWETRKTTRAAMRGAAASRLSVKEARRQADFARDALEHTKQTAAREFVAAHPPQIVFRVALMNPHLGNPVTYSALIRAVNVGATAAVVELAGAVVHVGTLVPATVEMKYAPIPPDHRLETGAFHQWPETSEPFGEIERRKLMTGDMYVFAIGTVRYRDDNGSVRQAGFCRRLKWATNRFEATNDPDFEYAH